MLMQSFKSAVELNIPDEHYEALKKTLVLFETGKVKYQSLDDLSKWGPDGDLVRGEVKFDGLFNMDEWRASYHGCGTVACIGGTAELVGNVKFSKIIDSGNMSLYYLFYPNGLIDKWENITVEKAARALRNYLTHGEPRWKEVMGLRKREENAI
jgi:hypothetical protein